MYIACLNTKSVVKENLQAFKKRKDAEKWLAVEMSKLFENLYKNESVTSQLFAHKYFDVREPPVKIKKEYKNNFEAMAIIFMMMPLMQQAAKPEIFDKTSLKDKGNVPEAVQELLRAKREQKKVNCKCVDCDYCKVLKEDQKKQKEAKKKEKEAKKPLINLAKLD